MSKYTTRIELEDIDTEVTKIFSRSASDLAYTLMPDTLFSDKCIDTRARCTDHVRRNIASHDGSIPHIESLDKGRPES